jgi:hypothetical protein
MNIYIHIYLFLWTLVLKLNTLIHIYIYLNYLSLIVTNEFVKLNSRIYNIPTMYHFL